MKHHDQRCPQCGRFTENDADGFYDSDDKRDTAGENGQGTEMIYGRLACFCSESCADRFHGRAQS